MLPQNLDLTVFPPPDFFVHSRNLNVLTLGYQEVFRSALFFCERLAMASGGDPRSIGHGPAVMPSPLREPMTPRTSWMDV